MDSAQRLNDDLKAVGDVLLWCFGFCFATLMFWFGAIVFAGDLAYGVHSALFELTRHEFNLINYAGMGLVKLISFTAFLFPYLAHSRSGSRPAADYTGGRPTGAVSA